MRRTNLVMCLRTEVEDSATASVARRHGLRYVQLFSATKDHKRIARFYESCGFEQWSIQFYRDLNDTNDNAELAALEERLTLEANSLGIGPMGFGGETTVLGVKIGALHRLPASFFVTASYMCWADRRRTLTWRDGAVEIV